MRFRCVLYSAVLLAALGGCARSNGGGPANQAEAAAASVSWTEPANYAYVVDSSCGERLLIGRFRITVTNAQVSRVEPLDPDASRELMLQLQNQVPTLGKMMADAEKARRAGAAKVDVRTDPADGHPTLIAIDHEANAVDDEECYAISDYTIEVKPAPSGVPSR
jgi:uncharacterized protein DUF6174